ncbi:hypothetical protein [Burkholderia anthina]|uniref:hypothetical protein n=1 Tax=Burkholderia anthina TaxID=179879 RepID=UPI00158D8BA1|nr:hypothetical protein [Burkholderia anthina]
MWPTVKESRFSKNWAEAWGGGDRDQISGGNNGLDRGERSAREVLAATDEEAYTPGERLRALTDAVPSVRRRVAPVEKPAPTVEKRVEPARVAPVEPTPEPEAPKPAASVFAVLADTAISAAAEQAVVPRRDVRFDGKHANAEGVAASWSDPNTRVVRMVRESVEVTLPSGEVRVYPSTAKAFEGLRLDVKKHIRFRQKLKEKRECDFMAGASAYRFKLVPFGGRYGGS